MAEKRLVISIFDAEADADEAAAALRDAGAVVDDAIGVLVLDERGELKTHKVGATSGGKGAAAGAVLALLGPIGLGVGVVGGALLGKPHHKDSGSTTPIASASAPHCAAARPPSGCSLTRTSSSRWSPFSSAAAVRRRHTSSTRRRCARPPTARAPDRECERAQPLTCLVKSTFRGRPERLPQATKREATEIGPDRSKALRRQLCRATP